MNKKIAALLAGVVMVSAAPAFASPVADVNGAYSQSSYQQLANDDDDWGCYGGGCYRGRGNRGGYCWGGNSGN